MKKLMMAITITACAANALAMPTKAELTKAQPLVVELMAPAMAKFKAAGYKEKTAAAAKVGDASSAFAKAAETEAAKFLLLKGAVNFYTRGEQYDKAADTITMLQREIKDVPPAVIAEITGKATSKISEAKAPRLYAVYRSAKLQVRAGDEAKALAAKLKKVQSDVLQRKYAEALAVSGDWKAAYAEFVKVNNAKLKEIVKDEAAGKAKSAESGEFWWAYEPTMQDAEDFFKSHAAAYYRKALDAGEITGLKKNIVEQRIAGITAEAAPSVTVAKGGTTSTAPACVTNGKCDIVTGGKSPFEMKGDTLIMKLENGKTVEFVKCPAGEVQLLTDYEKNEMRKVKITRPFWITKLPFGGRNLLGWIKHFETGKAWCWNKTELGFLEFEKYCGDYTKAVSKFLPKGYVLRLPSLAECEYAYHAGNYSQWDLYGNVSQPHSQNELQAKTNDWGIGNFWYREKVLDRMMPNTIKLRENDREGGVINFTALPPSDDFFAWNDGDIKYRLRRNFRDKKLECVSTENAVDAWAGHQRLVIGPDLVSEWKAKHGSNGATATASSSSAPSSGKAWQEKGNTAWLTLSADTKIEFVKCPAGKFKMVYDYKNGKTTPVSLSRPFWFSKTVLTRRQATALIGKTSEKNIPENAVDARSYSSLTANDDSVLSILNAEHGSSIPKGYVFRVPTLAEYQYAFQANTTDRKNPYHSILDRDAFIKSLKSCNDWAEVDPSANPWGIHDFKKASFVLDKIAELEGTVVAKVGKDDKLMSVFPPSSATDPLYWHEKPSDIVTRINWTLSGVLLTSADSDREFVHIVVGPDLVSEWRAKHGKK